MRLVDSRDECPGPLSLSHFPVPLWLAAIAETTTKQHVGLLTRMRPPSSTFSVVPSGLPVGSVGSLKSFPPSLQELCSRDHESRTYYWLRSEEPC